MTTFLYLSYFTTSLILLLNLCSFKSFFLSKNNFKVYRSLNIYKAKNNQNLVIVNNIRNSYDNSKYFAVSENNNAIPTDRKTFKRFMQVFFVIYIVMVILIYLGRVMERYSRIRIFISNSLQYRNSL